MRRYIALVLAAMVLTADIASAQEANPCRGLSGEEKRQCEKAWWGTGCGTVGKVMRWIGVACRVGGEAPSLDPPAYPQAPQVRQGGQGQGSQPAKQYSAPTLNAPLPRAPGVGGEYTYTRPPSDYQPAHPQSDYQLRPPSDYQMKDGCPGCSDEYRKANGYPAR